MSRYPALWRPDFTKGIIDLPCLEYIDLSHCNFEVQYFLNRIPNLKYVNLTGVNLLESQKKKLNRGDGIKIESQQLKPDLIYMALTKKEIIRSEAIYQLKTLLERTDITSEGMRCIEILEKLSNTSLDTFQILENCLVAFNNPYYRVAAAKAIICQFLKRGQEALILIVEHDPSVLILAAIYQFLGKMENDISKRLRKKVIERYEHSYNLLPNEALFILDLHVDSINDYSTNFPLKEKMSLRGEIENNHIISLNLSEYNYLNLPASIGNLSMLKSLDLHGNMFRELPDIWDSLKNLESLDLSNNKFLEEIPESLYQLSEHNFAKNYIDAGVKPEEAVILGVFEILLNKELEKQPSDSLDWYKTNKDGHIVEIKLVSYNSPFFSIISKIIDRLKYLERLVIKSSLNDHQSEQEIIFPGTS
jgi:hypothetical protein